MLVVASGLKNKMIIIKLKGGIGNQLFQYATGRALFLRRLEDNKNDSTEKLLLDISDYDIDNGIDTPRYYALSVFDIEARVAGKREIEKLKYPLGVFSKFLLILKTKVLRQFNIGFIEKIFNSKDDIYLEGFFQTERYFIDKRKEIIKELKLKTALSLRAQGIGTKISESKNSVSLHVRRGDYVNNKDTNKYHGLCSVEYYSEAIKYITSKIGNDIQVFVFSDDINWAKDNIKLIQQINYVSSSEPTRLDEVEELILMSKCKHNIIANSSYSWWGAWLNINNDKIVIAPNTWSLKDTRSRKDIIPNTWHRM
jgi:hypothetical protein